MAGLDTVTRSNYEAQQQLVNATERRALELWRHVHPEYIAASFREIAAQLTAVVTTGQAAAALPADRYVESALEAQGVYDLPAYDVIPDAYAGYASDGRPLGSLLAQPTITAKTLIGGGLTPRAAVAAAGQRLGRIVATQVADANRAASQASLLGYRTVGWVRHLNPPSCSRCVILAGKWFRWNDGFQRHPRCFPAGTVVSAAGVDSVTRRWYEGELTTVRTASGEQLSATGNHPVLTDQGWVPAHLLKEGDRVVRSTRPQGVSPVGAEVPHEQQAPARIEDLWRAGRMATLRRVPVAAEDFHGDGLGGDVDVVSADGDLRAGGHAALSEQVQQTLLPHRADDATLLTGLRRADQPVVGEWHAADSVMRGAGLLSALLDGHLRSADQPGRATTAGLDPCGFQPSAHRASTDPEPCSESEHALPGLVRGGQLIDGQGEDSARWDAPAAPFTVQSRGAYARRGQELRLRLAGQVELDRVVEVRRVQWSGHVYNLSTVEGWYAAQGLIVSNCDCRHVPATEKASTGLVSDPYEYFRSLDAGAQEKAFGRSNARAIREGADINRVVNVEQRGLSRAGALRAQRYGTPTHATPDQIFRTAGTRTNAIRLLAEHGYITGPQTPGGNILGRYREGYGALGKGGNARAATNAVLAARYSGARDPLNRYTMTAAERRLYDAAKRVQAVDRGINPYLAAGTLRTPLTVQGAANARADLANQVAALRGDPRRGSAPAPPAVQKLARLLGLA